MAKAEIKIPAELFALAEGSSFEGELALEHMQAGPDEYTFDEPVRWQVDVTNTGGAFYVHGEAQVVGTCACARCLEPAEYELIGDIEGYYLIDPQDVPEEDADDGEGAWSDDDAPGEEELLALPADHIIDLEPLIVAALRMDAPDMPLCRDDCAGLCPQCGANLNEGPCGCGPDEALEEFARESNPFSVLADFTFE